MFTDRIDIYQFLEKRERELLDSNVRNDPARVTTYLAEDFQEVGRSGKTYSKADILETLKDEPPLRVSAEDFSFVPLAEQCILVRYTTHSDGQVTKRCSVWLLQEHDWRMVYHQGTPVTGGHESTSMLAPD